MSSFRVSAMASAQAIRRDNMVAIFTVTTVFCLLVAFVSAMVRNPACDGFVLCTNARNGTVIYNNITAPCTAKPGESWRCEWPISYTCPAPVSCGGSTQYKVYTFLLWGSLLLVALTILIFCVLFNHPRITTSDVIIVQNTTNTLDCEKEDCEHAVDD